MSDAGGGDNIWLMNLDGGEARALTKEDFRLLNNPVWHPNGQYCAARKHYTAHDLRVQVKSGFTTSMAWRRRATQ